MNNACFARRFLYAAIMSARCEEIDELVVLAILLLDNVRWMILVSFKLEELYLNCNIYMLLLRCEKDNL